MTTRPPARAARRAAELHACAGAEPKLARAASGRLAAARSALARAGAVLAGAKLADADIAGWGGCEAEWPARGRPARPPATARADAGRSGVTSRSKGHNGAFVPHKIEHTCAAAAAHLATLSRGLQ
jgi:hypothetical protein